MQIEEKRQIDCVKQEEDNKFVREDRRRAAILKCKAEELAKVILQILGDNISNTLTNLQERARVESEINEYRRKYQKKEDSREFDLNDPNRMQNAVAARAGDDDPRLGISSAQK